MMKEIEVKKCPFCGSEPEIFKSLEPAIVQCINPSCILAEFDGVEIDKWNTRPIEDVLQTELQLAKGENDKLNRLLEDEGLTISQNDYAYEVDRQTMQSEIERLQATVNNKDVVLEAYRVEVERLQHLELLVTGCGFEVKTVLGRECLTGHGVEYYPERKE